MVAVLPYRIAIGGENQNITDGIEMQIPILAVAVLRVLERAEIFGVAAMRVPIFRLNGEGVNAVDGYFHVMFVFYGLD